MNDRGGRKTRYALLALVAGLAPGHAAANGMHPDVPLLDASGEAVVVSGRPVSTMATCGGECHDTQFIAESSDHADAGANQVAAGGLEHDWQAGPGYFGGWNPLSYDTDGLLDSGQVDLLAWLQRYGGRHVGGGPAAELVEMDCLLCHGSIGDQGARATAMRNGDYSWANSVHYEGSGALARVEGKWQWDGSKFQPNGALNDGLLEIRKPTDRHCAQCHGLADDNLDVPLTIPGDLSKRHNTDRTGQLFSPQKLHNSGLNIVDKETLSHPFDVHSDRVVGCVNCHYSLNNPVYFRQRKESRPVHLDFDPRRLTSSDYLERPLHQFAKGRSTLGLAAAGTENTLRRCESCHDATSVHDWLPYRERHLQSLACETCHVPRVYGPALQTVDWTLLDAGGEPLRTYRGYDGDPVSSSTLASGFRPAVLPRKDAEGGWKLSPFNLVTSWFWVAGESGRPVARAHLEEAMLTDGGHRPELVAALDRDGDGRLRGLELRLTDEAAVEAVRARLEATGLEQVELYGDITPFTISHNVVNGRWATRECATCHGRGSVLASAFPLSGHQPPGLLPEGVDNPGILFTGGISAGKDGLVRYRPESREAGFYVLGLHAENWADALGALMFLGVSLGVTGHALARWLAGRRREKQHRAQRRVYMYDAYERLWHWLQASAILLLLFTGLVIHKPHVFGIFSFAYIVQVHNVLGFILLINAALALFYNLASGEIRQYLPRPRGFIGRSIQQAMYYSRGIFRGAPHPFEKTKEQKLNPLQQITYLAILNVLLPAQVVTGVLIWGLQRWPDIATSLGGLPALALVHTLVAWAFAAFIVMHVYLTTAAGHTPGAGIKAMIEGWDDVEQHASAGNTTGETT